MRKLLILSLLPLLAHAQDEYRAGAIPDALKANVHAVVRRHETVFTVRSAGEAVEQERRVITVLDAEGDENARHYVGYDKFNRVANFEGALYDATGKLIKRLKNADVRDYSNNSEFAADSRVKFAEFPRQPTYPYTVEFVTETVSRNLMFYPTWQPQTDEHTAVEQSVFTVRMPVGMPLRYRETRLPKSVKIYEEADEKGVARTNYSWSVANLAAPDVEPLSGHSRDLYPNVMTAPTDFEVQTYTGKLATWADLGRFYTALNVGRDALPGADVAVVKQLVAGQKTTADKVRAVYRHLQQTTRYISIQLGLGGWQTLTAEQVATNHYGDCKALTNYAKAMLRAIGIPAHEALVRAGSTAPDLLTDFPSFQFNHILLCVPDGRDSLWLECTASNGPAGYAGDFTGNRHALLILPDGGKLVRTPAYRPADNRQARRATISISGQGDATATVSTRYTGLQQDDRANALHTLNQTDQREWLLKQIHLPTFELGAFAWRQEPTALPAITETLTLTAKRWATLSGNRLFLALNPLSALSATTPATAPRKAPLVLDASYDFEDTDTLVYELPPGYVPEALAAPVSFTAAFGDYAAQTVLKGTKLTYTRRVTLHHGIWPPDAYTAWVAFRRRIARADNAQVVLVKP
jgi:transglutaminase-like putative cysteine protease